MEPGPAAFSLGIARTFFLAFFCGFDMCGLPWVDGCASDGSYGRAGRWSRLMPS